MFWKLLSVLGIVAIIAGGVVWAMHGFQAYSKDRERVETVVSDPLFGTQRTEVTYVEKYAFGLLPDDLDVMRFPNSYAFVLGTGVTALLVGMFMSRRRRT